MNADLGAVSKRRLVLAKHLLSHATALLEHQSPSSRLLAIHSLHNAVETALRAVILELEVRTTSTLNVAFDVMLTEVDKAIQSSDPTRSLPLRTEMRNLNAARNLAVHQAHAPSREILIEHRVFTQRFLERISQDIFQVEFALLSQTSLIACERIASVLELAAECLGRNSWIDAAGWSLVAFEYASRSASSSLSVYPNFHWPATSYHGNDKYLDALFKTSRAMHESLGVISKQIVAQAGGMGPVEFAKMSRLGFTVHLFDAGSVSFHYRREVSVDEARWAHQVVQDVVLEWQDAGLSPSVPERQKDGLQRSIEEYRQRFSDGASG